MGITNMYKVTQVMTGVAGAPFYLTGYYDKAAGTAQQAATSWANICLPPVSYFGTPLQAQPITNVDEINPVNGDKVGFYTTTTPGRTFTSVGEKMPTLVSLGLRWRTGVYRAGREIRGHTNITGFTEDANGPSGTPLALYTSDFQTRINSELVNPVARLVVWSKKNGEWGTVTQGSPAPSWYVLRSRRS